MGAYTVYVHVALGHVIENAGAGHAVAIARVAGIATGPILVRSELVINGIRIALARTGSLVYEGLDTGHDRRSERGSARAGPAAGSSGASSSTIAGVGPAKHVIMVPEAVGGKQRYVWSIANAVVGVTEDRLP